MKEYWVNVWKEPIGASYSLTIYGPPHMSVNSAVKCNMQAYIEKKIAYRIHVKMKELKFVTGSEIVRNRDKNMKELKHWMDN